MLWASAASTSSATASAAPSATPSPQPTPRASAGDFEDRLKALYGREQMAMIPPHMLSAFRRLSVRLDFTIEPVLAQIKAPTLLMSPDAAEPLITMDEQNMMRATIPNCDQIVFAGANHDIAYQQDERCAEAALEFIRKHSGGS
jgi:pimeloyl-ACP methyl ester carboxylesterase